MKQKKKVYDAIKIAKAAHRNREIQEYGKIITLRPTRVFDSKKSYKRVKIRKDEINDDF